MNYANQRKIRMDRESVEEVAAAADDTNYMRPLRWDKFYPVLRQLNGNELKVWLYCYKWCGAEQFSYSPATLMQDFGVSESTAQRAFRTLEQLGFLVRDSETSNCYTFYPAGQVSN